MLLRLDERIAFMEGQMGEHSTMIDDVRLTCARLEDRVDRFEDRVERRLDAIERKMDRGFVWLIGVQISTFVAVAAAMMSR
ncbi:MAG: hypothetical protein IT185_00115 [Acidobacteria bacterium]|nr:hypothetical protein [Acidobacteriota bacterium]